ncbi:MAG: hypothetical protein ACTSU5_03930 [Promethearchaeota archaeon]
MRWLVLVMRGLIVLAFVSLLALLLKLFNPAFINWSAFVDLFLYTRDFISFALFFLFSLLPFALTFFFAALFNMGFAYFNPFFLIGVASVFSRGLITSWFSFYSYSPQLRFTYHGGSIAIVASDLSNLIGALQNALANMFANIYYLVFQVFLVVAIVNGVRLVLTCQARSALKSVFYIVLMVVVPLSLQAFIHLLDLFGIAPSILTGLPNPLIEVIYRPFDERIRDYLFSSNFWIPIAMYGFVELAYQLEYVDLVTKPSVEREMRLRSQLRIIQEQARAGTAFVEEVTEEIREKKKKVKKTQDSARQFLTKALGGFTGVKEMIERHGLEKEERQWLEAAHDTRRLGKYVDRLFVEDPEAKNTLTAASSAPAPLRLVLSTFVSLVTRVFFVALIVTYVIHPQFLLADPKLPWSTPAIRESVEMLTPEVTLATLIPIILLFPVVGALIRAVNHEKLKRRLAEEGTLEALLEQLKQDERERWGFFKARKKKKEKKEEAVEEFISADTKKWREAEASKKKKRR